MTITRRTHKDGIETIVIQIGDVVEVMTVTEWSKAIANARIVDERT